MCLVNEASGKSASSADHSSKNVFNTCKTFQEKLLSQETLVHYYGKDTAKWNLIRECIGWIVFLKLPESRRYYW